ncbi:MAG: YraN family protein [Gammaproteobacteria bacterium]
MDTRAANGRQAEQQALHYLQARGLRLLERNFRSRHGEIDLIMQDADSVVFVEVRYRRSQRFGGAAASVDGNKQARLVSTALYYLLRNPGRSQQPTRFDVVAVTPSPNAADIEWIRDAFQVD